VIAQVAEFVVRDDRGGYVGLEGFRECVVPVLAAQPGFAGCLVLANRDVGRALGVTLWATEEEARFAGARLEQERRTGADVLGVVPATAALYDVVDRHCTRLRRRGDRP
jgi:hypothetical protein